MPRRAADFESGASASSATPGAGYHSLRRAKATGVTSLKCWWLRLRLRFRRMLRGGTVSVVTELLSARLLGEQLEELVLKRGQCPDDDRNILLMAHWALVFDHHKAILNNIQNRWCGSAFALVRPIVESLVRSHVAIKGSPEDERKLQQDEYRTNLETIGPWIDKEFGADGLFTSFLNEKARKALHSYTHGGISQLGRRFDGHNLEPTYDDGEIIEVIRVSTSAVWMVTNLVTKYLGFSSEAAEAQKLYLEWGKH